MNWLVICRCIHVAILVTVQQELERKLTSFSQTVEQFKDLTKALLDTSSSTADTKESHLVGMLESASISSASGKIV